MIYKPCLRKLKKKRPILCIFGILISTDIRDDFIVVLNYHVSKNTLYF